MTHGIGTRWWIGAAVAALLLAGRVTTAASDDGEAPVVAAAATAPATPAAGPASLGQQPLVPELPPLPTEQPADVTPSQTNTNQFNQLFQFETTPDICAAGEGYLSGQGKYVRYGADNEQVRGTVQGQYGVTDQIAVGAYVPVVYNRAPTGVGGRTQSSTDTGDVGLYGQYKFDKLVNPEIVDITAQIDLILPTGNATQRRDTGKVGVRPLALIYKDFGRQGPGTLGVYGLLGFTATTNSDLRVGVAATYEVRRLAAVVEFIDTTGTRTGKPQVILTPGLIYRGFKAFELAAGVPLGLNQGSPDWGVTVKLTYAFQN